MSTTTEGWVPARMQHAWAWQVMDRVFVRVAGTKPNPCYQVKLTEYMRESGGGGAGLQLGLFWMQSDQKCIQMLSPYELTESFFVGRMLVRQVRIDHAGGSTEIPVRRLPFTPGPLGGGVVAAADSAPGADQYTGWSRGSFDEAYQNAVGQVPVRFPDDLVSVRVVASGGLHGGFAGLNNVFVTVERADGSAGDQPGEAQAASVQGGDGGGCSAVYHAEQVPGMVIINAYGEHNSGGWQTFMEQLPIEIWPPQFRLVCIPPTGFSTDAITPFHARACFGAAERVETVTIHDADGQHEIVVDYVPD